MSHALCCGNSERGGEGQELGMCLAVIGETTGRQCWEVHKDAVTGIIEKHIKDPALVKRLADASVLLSQIGLIACKWCVYRGLHDCCLTTKKQFGQLGDSELPVLQLGKDHLARTPPPISHTHSHAHTHTPHRNTSPATPSALQNRPICASRRREISHPNR